MQSNGADGDLEARVLEVIKSYGQEGVIQSRLAEELGIEVKEVAKLIMKLSRKGLVKKETVTIDGRRVTKLYGVPRKIRIDVSLETLIEIPCFTCRYYDDCGPGGRWSPRDCIILSDWLERKVQERDSRMS